MTDNSGLLNVRGHFILGGSGLFVLDSVLRDKLLHAVQCILSISAGEQRVVVQPLISETYQLDGLVGQQETRLSIAYNSYNARRSSYSFLGSVFGISR